MNQSNNRADAWYFTELNRQAITFSRQEQLELLRKYRATRDPAAKDLLLRSVYRLILKRAREFADRARLWDFVADIAQEGVLGAMHALERHDGREDVKFSTYAVEWMRSYMGALRHYQVDTIHVPVKRRIAEQKAVADGNEPPMPLPSTVSLSEPLPSSDGEESGLVVEDTIGIEADQPERIVHREVRDEFVRSLKQRMNPAQLPIVIARFGLDGGGCRTHEEIARTRGTSKQAVHQMLHRAFYRFPKLQAINNAIG